MNRRSLSTPVSAVRLPRPASYRASPVVAGLFWAAAFAAGVGFAAYMVLLTGRVVVMLVWLAWL